MKVEGHTISSISEGLKKSQFSVDEILKTYQKKIAKEDKELNAYLSTFENSKFQIPVSKFTGSLAGIPCAIKDNILVGGEKCTAGSKILKNYISAYDATVVAKLKASGAVLLGKTNMDEFGMGSSTENSAFGPTKNPHNITRVAGGSSGGSAAAVAGDLAVFALGSDTGGSIRQPAAFCGVVGLKPTYGRVSRHGLVALASSLDQIGPLTKNVSDGALVLNAIAGHDKFDATTSPEPVSDYAKALDRGISGLRIGIPKEYFERGLDHEVQERVLAGIRTLESLGAKTVQVSLPHSKYALAAYYIVMPCEASANLARFDGIRYGHHTKDAETLSDVYFESRAQGFGPEVTRRILLGTFALSSGYYDAYYLKAQKVRAKIKEDFDKVFETVDVIAGPTTPATAFKLGEKSSDPLSMYLSDIYTVPVNLAGLPAISVPCGNGHASGLPVGLQLIGPQFHEETILNVAYQLEQNI